jgi:hypothetical protein
MFDKVHFVENLSRTSKMGDHFAKNNFFVEVCIYVLKIWWHFTFGCPTPRPFGVPGSVIV